MKTCSEIKVRPVLDDCKLFLETCCVDICNDERFPLVICDCIPCEADEDVPVFFKDGQHIFELRDEGGHSIYADQICSRMVLRCTAATDTMCLAVHNKYVGCAGFEKYPLKRTCHCFPKVKCLDCGCQNTGEVETPAKPEI